MISSEMFTTKAIHSLKLLNFSGTEMSLKFDIIFKGFLKEIES